MTELCETFGISRKTGHKWKERYAVYGTAGLLKVAEFYFLPQLGLGRKTKETSVACSRAEDW